jgi:hypothetical protein
MKQLSGSAAAAGGRTSGATFHIHHMYHHHDQDEAFVCIHIHIDFAQVYFINLMAVDTQRHDFLF